MCSNVVRVALVPHINYLFCPAHDLTNSLVSRQADINTAEYGDVDIKRAVCMRFRKSLIRHAVMISGHLSMENYFYHITQVFKNQILFPRHFSWYYFSGSCNTCRLALNGHQEQFQAVFRPILNIRFLATYQASCNITIDTSGKWYESIFFRPKWLTLYVSQYRSYQTRWVRPAGPTHWMGTKCAITLSEGGL